MGNIIVQSEMTHTYYQETIVQCKLHQAEQGGTSTANDRK